MESQKELNLDDTQVLWSAKEIAAYIGRSERHVKERVVHAPKFPNPVGNIKGRWIKADIIKHYTRKS